jgi:hypothetical protein
VLLLLIQPNISISFFFFLFLSFAGRRVFFLLIPPVVDGKEMQNKKEDA